MANQHPFGAEPRHEIAHRPDMAELQICGHIYQDQDGDNQVCILSMDQHGVPEPSADAYRMQEMGFALQKIVEVTNLSGDMVAEPDAQQDLDARTLLAYLQMVHDVAVKALAKAAVAP